MKLNKTEAASLASLIRSELRTKINEFNNLLIDEEKKEFLNATEITDFVIFMGEHSTKSLEEIQNYLFNTFKRHEVKLLSYTFDLYSNLKDEVLIKTLEYDSVPLYEIQTHFVNLYWDKIKKGFDDTRPKQIS